MLFTMSFLCDDIIRYLMLKAMIFNGTVYFIAPFLAV